MLLKQKIAVLNLLLILVILWRKILLGAQQWHLPPTKKKLNLWSKGRIWCSMQKRVIWCSKSAKESVLSIDIKCWVSGNIAKRKLLLCSDAIRAILSWIYLVWRRTEMVIIIWILKESALILRQKILMVYVRIMIVR